MRGFLLYATIYGMPDFLIDTHCHLHDREWFSPEQAEELLSSAVKQNVKQVICIGTDPQDSQVAEEFAGKHPGVFWTYGIHPEHSSIFSSSSENDEIKTPDKLVAIGEIGLDYHCEPYDRDAQIKLFERMLQLARDQHLPISLHIRGAFDDAWAVLDNFPELTGVVHSFTGSKKQLKIALNRDFYIGVNGLATYSTLPLPPLEKMLLETDAPFLTPVPFRGKMNEPGYVSYVASYLAENLGVAEKEIVEQTTKNARQLFNIGTTTICQPNGV